MAGGWSEDLRRHVMARVQAAAVEAVRDGAEYLLEEADRTVPIEEGTMSRSGATSVVSAGSVVTGAVSYDTPYAVRQHEDTRLRHDKGRRAKWLEHTFKEQSTRVGAFIADRMRRSLGG